MFVEEDAHKCCNVVSLSLYFKELIQPQDVEKYIFSIERTVKNVESYLKDFIVRLYLDKTVYEYMESLSSNDPQNIQILISFNYILNSDVAEVYSFYCEKDPVFEKRRIMRFLPMVDLEVNVCIVREADGIVSKMDCHNISLFSKDETKLFYFPDYVGGLNQIIKGYDNKDVGQKYYAYQHWLRLYKGFIKQGFYDTHHNITDILAGGVGTKITINNSYFVKKIIDLSEKIESVNSNINREKIINFFKDKHLKIKFTEDSIKRTMDVGFDEMLLLCLYEKIISLEHNEYKTEDPISTPQFITTNIEFIKSKYISKLELLFIPNIKLAQYKDETLYYDNKSLTKENINKILIKLKNVHDNNKKYGLGIEDNLENYFKIAIEHIKMHWKVGISLQLYICLYLIDYMSNGHTSGINLQNFNPKFLSSRLDEKRDLSLGGERLINVPYIPLLDAIYDGQLDDILSQAKL